MRQMKCVDIHGTSVQEVLEQFNERQEELMDLHGFSDESDIISVCVRPPSKSRKIHNSDHGTQDSNVLVTFFFWSNS